MGFGGKNGGGVAGEATASDGISVLASDGITLLGEAAMENDGDGRAPERTEGESMVRDVNSSSEGGGGTKAAGDEATATDVAASSEGSSTVTNVISSSGGSREPKKEARAGTVFDGVTAARSCEKRAPAWRKR